ncbi:MAG: hypothetical protein R3F59_05965 [Myxococcota bacterium]
MLRRTPPVWLVAALVAAATARAAPAPAPPDPAPAAAPAPPDPAAVWARARQEQIPALRARAEVARNRTEARERFFAGQAPLPEAFPDLAGRDLSDPAVVRGDLALLSDRDTARAAERVAELPDVGTHRAELDAARQTALDAEDRAAGLLRRALSGTLAHLDAHPELARSALDQVSAPLRATVAAASAPDLDDEARAARVKAAALADADLARLDALVAALRRAALVPTAVPPDPADDIGRLGDPTGADAAADRLRLLRPFLTGDPRTHLDDALLAWLQGPRLAQATAAAAAPAPSGDLPALQADLTEAEATLAALKDRVHEAPAGDAVAAADQAVLAEEVRGAEQRVEALRTAVSGADAARQVSTADAARRSEADAAAARERAANAMAEARDDAERRAAEALAAAADARANAAAAWESAKAAEAELDQRRARNGERIAKTRSDLAELRTAGLLDTDRPDPDAMFRDLRTQLNTLRADARAQNTTYSDARTALATSRAEVAAERTRLEAERRSLTDAPDPARTDGLAAVAQWEEALDDVVSARAASVDVARSSVDETFQRLREIHELRESVRPSISGAAARDDRAYLLEDLGREFALLPSRLAARGRDRLSTLRQLPARALDFNALRAFFFGSFWILIVLAGWYVARRRAGTAATDVARRVAAVRAELTFADVRGAIKPLRYAIETLLDLAVGWLMIGAITRLSPELGLLLLVYLHVAGYRFLLAAFELLFARHPSFRPALRTLRPEVYDRARLTVSALLAYIFVRRLVLLFATNVFGLYTTAGLFRSLFTLLSLALAVWLAWTWEPVLRAAMARRQQGSRVIAWLSQPPRHWALAVPNALLSLVFLGMAFAMGILPRLAREGTRMGSLVTRIGSYGLVSAKGPEDAAARLPAEDAARILDQPGGGEAMVPRAEAVDAVVAELTAWQATGGASLVVISADAGEGKSVVLGLVEARLDEVAPGRPHVRVQLPGLRAADAPTVAKRLVAEEDAVAWLLALAGGGEPDAPPTLDSAVAALEALPPTTFLVEDLHRAFLRVVGGFGAVRALLHAMNATAARHFWIVTAHRPAWRHLAQLSDLVDTAVVRRTVELRPMGEKELRTLTLARTRAAGIETDYRSLVRTSVLGDDPAVELERATSLFYRLLAEVSDGNPSVAMHLWVACLRKVDATHAKVVVDDALSARVTLTLPEMFVLAALRTHDWLSEAEIVEVTNLGAAKVRGVVKHLRSRRLLCPSGTGFEVPHAAQAAVSRALIRQNVVQWG